LEERLININNAYLYPTPIRKKEYVWFCCLFDSDVAKCQREYYFSYGITGDHNLVHLGDLDKVLKKKYTRVK
jgi:hypothetical protein